MSPDVVLSHLVAFAEDPTDPGARRSLERVVASAGYVPADVAGRFDLVPEAALVRLADAVTAFVCDPTDPAGRAALVAALGGSVSWQTRAAATLAALAGDPLRSPSPADPARPDDLRAAGWSVAVHNDYRLHGQPYTFWLFTRGRECIKGEGETDAVALNHARTAAGLPTLRPASPGVA